jgi:hypothetical protein
MEEAGPLECRRQLQLVQVKNHHGNLHVDDVLVDRPGAEVEPMWSMRSVNFAHCGYKLYLPTERR